MKLYKDTESIVWIADIETLKCLITFGFYNPDTLEWKVFEISEEKNDLSEFISFYNQLNIDYVVGFNYRNFDSQVIQWTLENQESLFQEENLDICARIYEFTQDLIDDQNYHLGLKYREDQFAVKVIDVFLINGLDNEARLTSLKSAAFQTDGIVEEMPIGHNINSISSEEKEMVISYMKNDILETKRLLDITIGNTSLKSYNNVNQIELRINIQEEFGINVLNMSDIKIGEELLKQSYAREIGKSVREIPRRGTFRKEIRLKNCVPSYVTFTSDTFKDLHNRIKNAVVSQDDKLENKFTFGKTKYVQGLGGLHSVNENEIWEAKDGYLIEDDDVSSYYPAIVVNNKYYPYHLGKELLTVYEAIYRKRLELKPLAKKDKKIKGITEAYKLILNSCFGKFGSKESWLYDKQTLLSVTLTGQFSLLMLIEMLENEGIRVISANSDGITTYFHKDLLDKKKEIVKKWQTITQFEIETVSFKKFIYSTVNDYLAIDENGKIKRKGDFEVNDLLWKNKSFTVIPLALENYFINGIKPEDFVIKHNNIFDFCARAKSSKNFHYEGINPKTKQRTIYHKLIRYFISKEGEKLLKIKNAECTTNAASESQANAGKWLSTVCNNLKKEDVHHLNNIDYSFYLEKINSFIFKIENNKKPTKPKFDTENQLQLF